MRCASLTVRDLPGFADPQRDNRPRRRGGRVAPAWNPAPGGLPAATAVAALRNRARMAQSADRMVGRILDAVGPDTYVILTSDNGFHLGQQGLALGKGTAYTTDTRVPLLVVGPGVAPGPRREMVSNLDLAPTLEALAGLASPAYRSGVSFVPSLKDRSDRGAATTSSSSTPSPVRVAADPDGVPELDRIPSYVAVRSRTRLLIRLDLDRGPGTRYVWELYDLTRDRFEKTNVYGRRAVRRRRPAAARRAAAVRRAARAPPGNDPVLDRCRTLAQAD